MGRHVCEMLTHQFWTPTTRTVHPVLPDIGSPQRALTSTPTAGPFYLANRNFTWEIFCLLLFVLYTPFAERRLSGF